MKNRRLFCSTAVAASAALNSRSVFAEGRTAKLPSYLSDYEMEYVADPRVAASEWFRNAKFGLFLHYGLYSLEGRHEWLQLREKIPVATYIVHEDENIARITASPRAFKGYLSVSLMVPCLEYMSD